MDENVGTPARYIECMEFFLAPTPVGGGTGDPTKAPDISINSWVCPTSEGCSTNTLQAAVEAQKAAGIMMVVAAGNAGSSCSTVSDPPSFYDASYTVGALNTGTDTAASFSSRGPVTADGSNRIKPNIAAPGTGTRSASNLSDSAYTIADGTSMATPHIAGSMALLWSAHPELKNQIDTSRDTLNSAAHFISSTQCGTAGPPNNVYGWGRVDILAAVGSGTTTITLQARVKGQGTNHNVQLKWSPADGGRVNLIRNGSTIGSTTDDGAVTDKLGTQTGSFTYKVCETDSSDCSNEVTVTVP
jgi:subtilisin family serine protease